MAVPFSKNKPQYAFLALLLGGTTALFWTVAGPVFAVLFLVGAFVIGALW